MLAVDIVLTGLIIGGMYAFSALGLTLQYGVARIMNLSYGEILVGAALSAYWLYTTQAVSPLVGLIVIVPIAFALNWLIFRLLLTPLVRRARNEGMLEVDSILATFGLLFVMPASRTVTFGGNYLQLLLSVDPGPGARQRTCRQSPDRSRLCHHHWNPDLSRIDAHARRHRDPGGRGRPAVRPARRDRRNRALPRLRSRSAARWWPPAAC